MKVRRGAASAATVDGKIHVIGGRGPDGIVVAAHEVFDLQSGTWTDAAQLPIARDHMAVIAVDGKIHAIGGRTGRPVDRTDRHDVYDPVSDKWISAAPLPTSRSGLASAYYRGLILVLGGELPPDHTFPENQAYDPKSDRWETLAPMPHGRHGFGGDAISNDAYFVGGSLTPGDGGATHLAATRPTSKARLTRGRVKAVADVGMAVRNRFETSVDFIGASPLHGSQGCGALGFAVK